MPLGGQALRLALLFANNTVTTMTLPVAIHSAGDGHPPIETPQTSLGFGLSLLLLSLSHYFGLFYACHHWLPLDLRSGALCWVAGPWTDLMVSLDCLAACCLAVRRGGGEPPGLNSASRRVIKALPSTGLP